MLYIVPTPIGNLEDITLRAIKVLKGVDLIACEDTRTSKKLLNHFDISTPTISYHKFNESKRSQELITKLEEGLELAVISDAGTPGISDPASYLINEAIIHNIEFDVLPGATATIPALILSGLNTDKFTFCGFLPDKNKDKNILFKQIHKQANTLIFYVSPHSLEKTLTDFFENLGDRKIAIIREISKMYQSTYRGSLSHFIANFDEITLKGEFVVVIEGFQEKNLSDEQILIEARKLLTEGISISKIAKDMSQDWGLKKNKLYQLFLDNDLQ